MGQWDDRYWYYDIDIGQTWFWKKTSFDYAMAMFCYGRGYVCVGMDLLCVYHYVTYVWNISYSYDDY